MYASEKDGGRPVLRLCMQSQSGTRKWRSTTNRPHISNKEIPEQYPSPLHHYRRHAPPCAVSICIPK
jgi:hypothetical protein